MAIPTSAGHQRVTAVTPSQAAPTHELTTGTPLPAPWCRAERDPGWYSRFGAILAPGRAPGTGQPLTKQWEECWGCALPCDSSWVPCTLLCPPCVGPTISLGQLIPTPGPEQRTAVGVSVGFRSKITMEHGKPWTGLGRVQVSIRRGDGSQHSHAASPSSMVRWAQAALLTPQLLGTAARSHFSRLRLVWMSLIAQRSVSPSPGPRVGGTPGRNLTRTQVSRDQRRGSGNYNGHEPKYAARPPR